MTIGRFYERLTIPVLEDLFAQFTHLLSKLDSVTMDEVYIDGTKLEANANRYTFVWRKNIERGLKKLKEQPPYDCRSKPTVEACFSYTKANILPRHNS